VIIDACMFGVGACMRKCMYTPRNACLCIDPILFTLPTPGWPSSRRLFEGCAAKEGTRLPALLLLLHLLSAPWLLPA
jgi:hypothetical protein